MDAFDFALPADAPADMAAIAQLGASTAKLAAAVDTLHQQYLDLRDAINQPPNTAGQRKAPPVLPWPLRWDELDRDTAAQAWAWLIGWVGWLVERYQLAEEVPACWYRHPPLIEELTALAAAWHVAYDDAATADGPLLWHERFARARPRLRDWDDYTRCRNGQHHDRHLDLAWPGDWREGALEAANADLAARSATEPARQEQP